MKKRQQLAFLGHMAPRAMPRAVCTLSYFLLATHPEWLKYSLNPIRQGHCVTCMKQTPPPYLVSLPVSSQEH